MIKSLQEYHLKWDQVNFMKFKVSSLDEEIENKVQEKPIHKSSIGIQTSSQDLNLQSQSLERRITELTNTISHQNETILSLKTSLADFDQFRECLVQTIKSSLSFFEKMKDPLLNFCSAIESKERNFMSAAWRSVASLIQDRDSSSNHYTKAIKALESDHEMCRFKLMKTLETLKKVVDVSKGVVLCDNTVALYIKRQELKTVLCMADTVLADCQSISKSSRLFTT